MGTVDPLNRAGRLKMRVGARFEEYTNEFRDEDLAPSCFKVAVCEILEEEQWKRVLDRTRALINKIKS